MVCFWQRRGKHLFVRFALVSAFALIRVGPVHSNFHVLEEDVAYFRKVFNNSYNANEFYLKDIHGLYVAMMEDMSFM